MNASQVGRVLIVDDIQTNRFLMAEILEQLGVLYDEAENGREALLMIERNKYSCVFMDVEMPVMNGVEATMYIQSRVKLTQPTIKVFGVTAHDPKMFSADYQEVIFDGFITKPFNFEKIKNALEITD